MSVRLKRKTSYFGGANPLVDQDEQGEEFLGPGVTPPYLPKRVTRQLQTLPETQTQPGADEEALMAATGGYAGGESDGADMDEPELVSARERHTSFHKPQSLKRKLISAAIQAAPMLLTGIFGDVDMAGGAAQGVLDYQGRERELEDQRHKELQGDVIRGEAAQEKRREFNIRQRQMRQTAEQTAAHRAGQRDIARAQVAGKTEIVGGKRMQYNLDTGKYDIEVGDAPVSKKPVHIDHKAQSISDVDGEVYSWDDIDLPVHLKPVVAQAKAKLTADKAAADAEDERRFQRQLALQERSFAHSDEHQRNAQNFSRETKAKKIREAMQADEGNYLQAKAAFEDPNPENRPINDNTLLMAHIKATIPKGSRMTNVEIMQAMKARTLPQDMMNIVDKYWNRTLPPEQRAAFWHTVQIATAAKRQAAEEAAALYEQDDADGGREFQRGGTGGQGQGNRGGQRPAPEATRVPVVGGGFKVKRNGVWVLEGAAQ
jgi:hypothetical protein